jgi:7-cyano-7-deazaguanine synthase
MVEPILTVLFSSGLDSAVLLAQAATVRDTHVQPVYVSTGLAWEAEERAAAARFAASLPGLRPLAILAVEMRDVYAASHWAVRGEAPDFDSADSEVYIEGRNIILLAKVAVYMAAIGSTRVWQGTLACNPFPDGNRTFFDSMQHSLTLGLAKTIVVETPFASIHKPEVIRLGQSLGVDFTLTLSCMQPEGGVHCGKCSKCRERRDAFNEAGVADPTSYATPPLR